MAMSSFVQKSNLFAFSAASCLRNDYYFNDCRLCIDVCPEGALNVVRNKLMLFETDCIECAGCIGSCPTEALTIESFDPNAYTIGFKEQEEKSLSCKKDTACLGSFDVHHLITMALRSEEPPVCDMAHCEECPINKEQKVETAIRTKIAIANDFMAKVGFEGVIETLEERPEENQRRALFRKAFDATKEVVADSSDEIAITLQNMQRIDTDVSLKYILLKNAIKEKMGAFTTTNFKEKSPLFFKKIISFDACTNCGDCVQFCPTHALIATSDKQGILFSESKCVGCGICDHICKTDAITTADGFDLVTIAYDRVEQLVHYEMVMCHECRCPYPYRGGDPICDRCSDFKKDFGGMFTLARDL